VENYNKVIELDPKNGKAYFYKAVVDWKKKDYPAAFENVNKAKELGETVDPSFMDKLTTDSQPKKEPPPKSAKQPKPKK